MTGVDRMAKSMAKRLRKGQILAVELMDHVEDGSEPIRFVVYGRLAEISRGKICLDSWAYVGDSPSEGLDINVKRFTIVRSAIKRITRLVEEKEDGESQEEDGSDKQKAGGCIGSALRTPGGADSTRLAGQEGPVVGSTEGGVGVLYERDEGHGKN